MSDNRITIKSMNIDRMNEMCLSIGIDNIGREKIKFSDKTIYRCNQGYFMSSDVIFEDHIDVDYSDLLEKLSAGITDVIITHSCHFYDETGIEWWATSRYMDGKCTSISYES